MGPAKCEICQECISKYKCPGCLLKYCSVACYKNHKAGNCSEDPQVRATKEALGCTLAGTNGSQKQTSKPEVNEETEDTVPQIMLEKLGQSNELATILENPHLQAIMRNMDESSNPGAEIHRAMQEPIFVEFADACLKVVEPHKSTVNVT